MAKKLHAIAKISNTIVESRFARVSAIGLILRLKTKFNLLIAYIINF